MKKSGIYQIRNLVNNKVYIGYSHHIKHRWNSHRYYLRKGTHYSTHLQRAWNKYGEDFFEFSILEECLIEDLGKREHYWTTLLESCDYEKGYNIQLTSESGKATISEITRQRMIKAVTGRKASDETKLKMSMARKGKKLPREVIEKIASANRGKKRSSEHREKLRIANIGKKASEDSRKKMSEFQRGREKYNRVRKKVIDTSTGIIYNSAVIAARELSMNKSNLYQKLKGNQNNNTTLKYLESND